MDDFLSKKRESGTVLDLSKATATTKEEFRKLFDRVPDYKIKPEKLKHEDVKVRDNVKKMKFKTGKKDYKAMKEKFLFNDPVPIEMKNLKINELAAVPIDWKMLTSVRPKNKIDEEFFSRMVELKKLEQKTETKDKRALQTNQWTRKVKNKAGVIEIRVLNCSECWEDFCTGTACKQYNYDSFTRVPEVPSKPPILKSTTLLLGGTEKTKKKKKTKKKERKSRSPRKNKSKKRVKSKSPTKK